MMESVSSTPFDLHSLQNYVAYGAIKGTSVSISLIYYGTQFLIKFEKQKDEAPPNSDFECFQKQCVEFMNRYSSQPDNQLSWWELCQMIVSVCLPSIIQLSNSRKSPKSLEEYLSVETFELKIQRDESESTIKVLKEGPSVLSAYDIHPLDRCSIHDESLPKISAGEILAESLQRRHNRMPQKVFTLDGSPHFFKPCMFGMEEHFIDEVQSLIKLRTEGIAISVPTIEGLAITSEGKVFGMLAQWIEGCAISAISQECRRRQSQQWRNELFSTMNLLHQAGILWGDINQGNIMIEEATNKAWIVDIGGGDNRVMLEEERFGGFAGDLEALTRFCESWLPE
jgi:hypothetical protein